MKARSAIGVAMGDGRVLAARGPGQRHVSTARTLACHYATRTRAAMLVSLGSVAALGPTPALSICGEDAEPEILASTDAFQALDATSFHLFDGARWTSWSTAPTLATVTIEMED